MMQILYRSGQYRTAFGGGDLRRAQGIIQAMTKFGGRRTPGVVTKWRAKREPGFRSARMVRGMAACRHAFAPRSCAAPSIGR